MTSAPLSGSNVTNEERAALKDNPLADVAAPAEVINAVVVTDDTSKEKATAGEDEASSFFYSTPLYMETDLAPPLMEEEEDKPKENPLTPL